MRLRLDPFQVAARVSRQHPAHFSRGIGQIRATRPNPGPSQSGRLAQSHAVGDLGLRVGIEQLIGQIRQRHRTVGIQIDHPRVEVRRFAGHHLPESPED